MHFYPVKWRQLTISMIIAAPLFYPMAHAASCCGGGSSSALILPKDATAMVDFSNPEARSWYTDHLARAVKAMNMKGWMADFGEALPFEAEMASGETGEAYHNRYIQEWAKVNREVLVQSGLKDDGFFFLRASAGQAHGATSLYWLGDQMVTWDQHDGLKSSITGLLSGGISGMAVNHSDIGGLIGLRRKVLGYKISFARDAELLLRWAEMNAFTPFYRTHEGNNPKLNHQFYSDQKTLKGFAYFAKVYSFLAPYRSKLFRDAHEKGIPVVRHPYLHYPKDPVARSLKYQFMLGDEFMVAPVTSPGQLEQQVYLPQGGWVHLWSDEVFDLPEGRTITIASPVGQPPVFFKEQSQDGQMWKNKGRKKQALFAAQVLDDNLGVTRWYQKSNQMLVRRIAALERDQPERLGVSSRHRVPPHLPFGRRQRASLWPPSPSPRCRECRPPRD